MKIDDNIEYIKKYLKEWIDLGRCPDGFRGLKMTDLIKNENLDDEKRVAYELGTILYSSITKENYKGELNHREIKKPRVYQFLKMVLDRDDVEINPDFLLSILEWDKKRDLIKERDETKEYKIDCLSTVGLTRLNNQDYLGCYKLKNGALVMIVADGVGGAESGEIASKIATEFVLESIKKHDLVHESNIKDMLQNTLFLANQHVLEYAKSHHMGRMGTTLSLALIMEQDTLYIAHVGDSRIYEYNAGKKAPRQITPDHSEVEILIREGRIREEDRKHHRKNLLRYAIGIENLKKENIFVQDSIIRGDTALLLCSDGLWEKIDITEDSFLKDIDELEQDIYEVVPTDNVTLLRYFAIEQESENVEVEEDNDFREIEPEIKTAQPKIEKRVYGVEKTERIEERRRVKHKKSNRKRVSNKKRAILGIIISIITVISIGVFTTLYFFKKDIKPITPTEQNETIKNQKIFFQSVKDGNITKVNQLLNSIDINITDEHNHTALYYSYKNMDIGMSKFLIKKGMDKKIVIKWINLDIKRLQKFRQRL
jgi:protein phosphatase